MEIQGITLLSKEEYLTYKSVIPTYDCWDWWLKSPGIDNVYAQMVTPAGIIRDAIGVGFHCLVRPAIIADLKSCHIGDKIDFAGHKWTVISENMFFIDDNIGEDCAFNEDQADGNDYNNSTIKAYCEKWLASHRDEPMYLIKDGDSRLL